MLTYWFALTLLITALVIPAGWCCCVARLLRTNLSPVLSLAATSLTADPHAGQAPIQNAPFCSNCLAVRPMPAERHPEPDPAPFQNPEHLQNPTATPDGRRLSVSAGTASVDHSSPSPDQAPASNCSCPSTQGHTPHDPRDRLLTSDVLARSIYPAPEVRLPHFLLPRPLRLALQAALPGLPDDPLPSPLHGSADRSQTLLGHWLI